MPIMAVVVLAGCAEIQGESLESQLCKRGKRIMNDIAMYIGYAVVFVLVSGIFGLILALHWRLMVCLICYMKVASHDVSFMGEEIRKKRFPRLRLFLFLLRGFYMLPIDAERVHNEQKDWSFYPGWWPKVYVNGVKI
jgi:hypothetical protein